MEKKSQTNKSKKLSQNDVLERAESLFILLDDTLDGEIDEEEFVR